MASAGCGDHFKKGVFSLKNVFKRRHLHTASVLRIMSTVDFSQRLIVSSVLLETRVNVRGSKLLSH